MNYIFRTIKWVLRAWPFLTIAGMVATHYALYKVLDFDDNHMDRVIGAILQVAGGLIVLYSINENIGTFKGHSLFSMTVEWLRKFPLARRSVTIDARSGSVKVTASASATVHGRKRCNSMEEQIDALQKQIDEWRQLVYTKEKEIKGDIQKAKEELKNEITSNSVKIESMNSLLTDTVVGGFQSQLFGVLLVIYGAVVGIM